MSDRQEHIIGRVEAGSGSTVSLAKIMEELNTNPQAEIVRVQGPTDNPSLLVALLTPEDAQQLQAQYQGQLIVEKNLPLQPF